jgi:hypothetical protein
MATQNLARGQAEARAASDSLKAALAAGTITQEQYHSSVLESKAAVSVLNAEWNQAQAEVREMSTALDIATAATRSNEAATEALKNAQQRMGATAGMNRAHLSNLAFQIQDVIVALQMGQAPAQVFLQQGGQIGQIMMQAGIGVRGLTVALWSLLAPWLPLVLAIGAVYAAFKIFQDSVDDDAGLKAYAQTLGLTKKEMKELKDVTVTSGDMFKGLWKTIADRTGVDEALSDFKDWFMAKFDEAVAGAGRAVATIYGETVGTYRAMIKVWGQLPAAMGDLFVQAVNAAISGMEALVNAGIRSVNSFSQQANDMLGIEFFGTMNEVMIDRVENQWEGAASNVRNVFREEINAATAEAQGAITSFFADWKANSIEAAKDRLRRQADEILSDRNPSKDSRGREMEKLRNELEAILRVVDPVRAAMLQLAKDEDTLNKAAKVGLITMQEQVRYLKILREEATMDVLGGVLSAVDPIRVALHDLAREEDLLKRAREAGLITAEQEIAYATRLKEVYKESTDPLGHMQDEIRKEIELTKMGQREREVERDVRQRILALKQAGVQITPAVVEGLRKELTTLQQANEQMQIKDRLLGESVEKRREFLQQIGVMKDLLADDTSGFTKNDAFEVMNSMTGGMLEHTQAGINAQIAALQNYYEQIRLLREADLISEEDAAMAKAMLDVKMMEMRMAGARDFFGSLTALSRSKNKELAAIGKAAAIAQATIDGVLAVQKALASYPPPWNFAVAAGVGVAAAANVAQIAGIGFEQGGFTGTGGRKQVAGVVHGQEFVFDADATKRIGVRTLEAMRSGGMAPSAPASAPPSSGGNRPAVVIRPQPGVFVEERRTSAGEIELIARRVVAEDAPKAVARDIKGSPNSTTSKAMGSAFGIKRADR